jgi:NADP-dependent 3-hydroxy acid dehydrogenase YdfG
MKDFPYSTALIIGAGTGISASLARRLARAGLKVGLAARNVEKLKPLAAETNSLLFAADAGDPTSVSKLFDDVDRHLGVPDVVIYNAGCTRSAAASSIRGANSSAVGR